MTTLIAHISDIHFGAVDLAAARKLAAQINDLDVDGVIVTGDLTQAGRKSEFAEAAQYLKTFTPPTLVVPGNHDVPVYNLGRRFSDPWSRWRRYVSNDLAPAGVYGDAFVAGLNSARRAGPSFDWSLGRLSRSQINGTGEKLRDASTSLKIIAFHHPVTPGPGRAGAAVIPQADRILSEFSKAGADLVLTGHAHIAQAALKETPNGALITAAAGTASSTRLRGEAPSYNLLRWDGAGALTIETHRYAGDGYAPEKQYMFLRRRDGWRENAS